MRKYGREKPSKKLIVFDWLLHIVFSLPIFISTIYLLSLVIFAMPIVAVYMGLSEPSLGLGLGRVVVYGTLINISLVGIASGLILGFEKFYPLDSDKVVWIALAELILLTPVVIGLKEGFTW